MELIVAHVAMATEKEFEKKHEKGGKKSKWKKWKRGGLIGAAAVTGGALLAVTGGTVFWSKFHVKTSQAFTSNVTSLNLIINLLLTFRGAKP